MPVRRAVSRMPVPALNNARIASAFVSSIGGRPRRVPLAFVRSNPARTREMIIERSNSESHHDQNAARRTGGGPQTTRPIIDPNRRAARAAIIIHPAASQTA